jgi:hypothetical protein
MYVAIKKNLEASVAAVRWSQKKTVPIPFQVVYSRCKVTLCDFRAGPGVVPHVSKYVLGGFPAVEDMQYYA